MPILNTKVGATCCGLRPIFFLFPPSLPTLSVSTSFLLLYLPFSPYPPSYCLPCLPPSFFFLSSHLSSSSSSASSLFSFSFLVHPPFSSSIFPPPSLTHCIPLSLCLFLSPLFLPLPSSMPFFCLPSISVSVMSPQETWKKSEYPSVASPLSCQ